MEKARKSYFKIKTSFGLDNPCKLLEKLFDALVKPILLYCCEVWGLDNKGSEPYELLHSKFVKEILGVHCKTSNAACLSELAKLPLKKSILVSSIKYLEHLITSRDSLAHDILMETFKYNPWVEKIKSCLQMLGFPFLSQRMDPVHCETLSASNLPKSHKYIFTRTILQSNGVFKVRILYKSLI